MSYTDIGYYLHQVDYLTPRSATKQLHNSHGQRHQAIRQVSQFDRPFLSPLPMPSPTSCWYPQQDVQIGYPYPDPACPIPTLSFSAPRPSSVFYPCPEPDPPDGHPLYTPAQPPYQPPCPPYTDPDSYGQPRNFDDGYHPRPLLEYQPPQPLPEYQPPRPLQVSDCSQHPLQQAAINDYNEKLRVYRLEQAALLARLNAWFEENTSDENLAEEKNDNTPVIVLGDDPPTDITGVPNDGATLDIPNNESVEEIVKKEGIVKNENELLPVLVEAYDDKIGDLIAPIHQELEIKDDAKKGFYVENLMEKCVSCYEDFTRMLIKSQSKRKIEASDIHSKSSRSHILFTAKIESWFSFRIQSLIYDQHQPCVFDPGGELSTLFVLKFPP